MLVFKVADGEFITYLTQNNRLALNYSSLFMTNWPLRQSYLAGTSTLTSA